MPRPKRFPFRLLAAALFVAFAGYGTLAIAFVKLFGNTIETHVPATEERKAASAVIAESANQKDVYTPKFQQGMPLALGTRLSHHAVEEDSFGSVHMALTVVATAEGEMVRAPLNVAVVIDQSGSMLGEKMDVAREAARNLIRGLRDGDTVSIVAYDDAVQTLLEPTQLSSDNRWKVEHTATLVQAGGGTYISGGLQRGAQLVDQARTPDSINRIVLLSDGRATSGALSAEEFSVLAAEVGERGIGISTVGMGLDYDEDIMQAIARAAAGRYYFVAEAIQTRSVFKRELESLLSTVAREATVTITMPDGVSFVDVEGFQPRVSASEVRFELGALAAGDRSDLLIEFRVDAERSGGFMALTTLDFVDVASDQPKQLAAGSRLTVARNQKLNAEVAERVQQVRTARAFDEAMRLYDAGDRYAAAALLDRQRDENEEFIDDTDLDSPAFERVGKELEELADALRRTERHSSAGKYYSKSGKFRSSNIVQNQVAF